MNLNILMNTLFTIQAIMELSLTKTAGGKFSISWMQIIPKAKLGGTNQQTVNLQLSRGIPTHTR